MSQSIVIAVIALLGAVIGGLIQAANQRRLAKGEYLRRQKAEAYIKYFQGIAQLSHSSGQAETKTAYSVISEARSRIAMYGSSEVVEKMAAVFRLGPIQRADMQHHVALIIAMRSDASGLTGNVSADAAFELLYGNPEKY
jgi:Mn2+/Fe2+ NRAMP family transporter